VLLACDPSGSNTYFLSAYHYFPERDHLHKFDEIVLPQGASTSEMKLALMKKPYAEFVELIVVDARRSADIKEWKQSSSDLMAFNAVPSVVKEKVEKQGKVANVAGGIRRLNVRMRDGFGKRRYTLNTANCPKSVLAFTNYGRQLDKTTGLPIGELPTNHYKDGPDTDRYMNDYIMYEYTGKRKSSTIHTF
jgi:hypothetical protein